jgi:U3 small nucleolar RNA-associated protein 25
MIFSDFLTPEFNALFNKHLKNVSGKLKIKKTVEDGSILDVVPQVQQVSLIGNV